MEPAQRKMILVGKKIKQISIAREQGVTLSAVNNLLHDRGRKSKKLCTAIAELYMGLPVYIVWPAWFKKEECMATSSINVPNGPVCVNGKP